MTIRIDKELHNAAKLKAVESEITLSELIRQFLAEWVEGKTKLKDKDRTVIATVAPGVLAGLLGDDHPLLTEGEMDWGEGKKLLLVGNEEGDKPPNSD